MKKRILAILLSLVLLVSLMVGCGNNTQQPAGGGGGGGATQPPAGGAAPDGPSWAFETGYQKDMQKDFIEVVAIRPVTGILANFEATAFGPNYKMWVEVTNRDGGLYVKSLDRKVPIRLTTIDEGSDVEKMTQLLEQTLGVDKPDIILSVQSTAFLFAAAPIVMKHGYLMVGAEGGAKELADMLPTMKEDYGQLGFFPLLSYSETQSPALVKVLQDLGITSVYCAYINDLHGIEYWNYTEKLLKEASIEIRGSEPVDWEVRGDIVINNAMASGAQAFLGFLYPPQSIPITITAVELDYNPDFYLLGPGSSYDDFCLPVFGDPTLQSMTGISGWGAWNEKSNPAAKAYSEMFREFWIEEGSFWRNADGSFNPNGTVFQDWWGHICYWSAMQVYQQAVENAGELDSNGKLKQSTLIDYVENNAFDTVMNPQLRFTNNILLDDMYLGNVGQWQNGVFEVIDADGRRTADPIFPKPPWTK